VSFAATLAEDLTGRLLTRDPLKDRVHHARGEMPGLLTKSLLRFAAARLSSKSLGSKKTPT